MAVGFNLPDPYEAQKADIARRQKYAEILQQQAFQPVEQFSYQGIPAPVPIAATLAKILQGAGGAYLMKKSEDEARELREGDIKKSQEFAAALQGAKTPEERQALAFRGIGGEFGQRGQIIGSGEYQMAETRAEAERKREARRQEVEDRLQAQREAAADRLASQQAIAGMAAGMRADIEAGRREDRARDAAEKARLAEERRRDPTVQAINTYNAATSAEQEAGSVASRMAGHIEDINSGKLSLGFFANPINRARNWAGISSEEGVKLAALDRDIVSAANVILMRAKGTQTEGDARRAVDQILAKATSSDPKIVKDALTELVEKSKVTQNAYRTTLNQLGERFNLGHETLPMVGVPGAPAQRPAAPQAPGAAPGQPAAPDINALLNRYAPR